MKKAEKIFNLVVGMGEVLISSDAETLRVIETMEIVAKTLGLENFNSFTITNGLFVTASYEDQTFAQSKQIRTHQSNLGKIDAINTLSRNIAQGIICLDEAICELEKIKSQQTWSAIMGYVFVALGCSSLTILYGGTYVDAVVTTVISLLVRLLTNITSSRQINQVITNLMASICISILAILSVKLGIGENVDKIIIGSIMVLVPGILLTNGIRDIANNDYLSGIIRIIEALLIATSIAIGVGIVFNFL